MAFTTEYTFELVRRLHLDGTASATDITGLSDGGLAGLGDVAEGGGVTLFDSDLHRTGGVSSVAGVNGSIDQLANGNLVVAGEVPGTVSYRITTASGATVLGDTLVGDGSTTTPDVAALSGGGFVIATVDHFADNDNDIDVGIYTSAGVNVTRFAVDGSAADDQGAAITGLADGGFAVAWTRTVAGAETQAWYAVCNADGSDRVVPTLLDAGGSVNSGMSIVALNTGGFAIAYQDNGWEAGYQDITFARFDQAGGHLGSNQATAYAGTDSQASLTALSNGMIAVSYSALIGGDNEIYLQLVDPATGAALLAGPHIIAATSADETDSAAAAWGLAGVAVSYEGGAHDAGAHQLARTAVGDNADDLIAGDDAVDRLSGGFGADTLSGLANADDLRGEGGDDSLYGGDGADNLAGGAGDDRVLAGSGADAMSGGGGIDTLDYSLFDSATFLDLADTAAQNTRSAGADAIIGFENVLTGGGADRIFGAGSDNRIETAGGADTIKSKGGSDVIVAGAGDDVVNAGTDADTLDGGLGRDVLRGGAQGDLFDFNWHTDSAVGVGLCDVIRDFRTADGDRIDLAEVFAGGELIFIGSAEFTGGSLQQEVRVGVVAEGQLVQVDLTGDGNSEMDILVTNSGLSGGAADFVL